MKILYKNIAIIKTVLIISLLSGILSACATQLPAFDPSLPDSETAILVIPKNIYVITMDGQRVGGWENGQVRIPAGRHWFTATAEENWRVPLGYMSENLFTGTSQNYIWRKMRGGPTNMTFVFLPGKKYKIYTTMDWDGSTFASQDITFWTEPYENTASPLLFEVPIVAYGGQSDDDPLNGSLTGTKWQVTELDSYWGIRYSWQFLDNGAILRIFNRGQTYNQEIVEKLKWVQIGNGVLISSTNPRINDLSIVLEITDPSTMKGNGVATKSNGLSHKNELYYELTKMGD